MAPNTESNRREEEDEAAETQLVDENEDILIADLLEENSSYITKKQHKQKADTERLNLYTVSTRQTKHIESKMRLMNDRQQEIFYAVRKWCLLKSQGKHPDPIHILVHSSGGC